MFFNVLIDESKYVFFSEKSGVKYEVLKESYAKLLNFVKLSDIILGNAKINLNHFQLISIENQIKIK